MKKLTALLLALAMVFGLVACGAKEEAATPAATEAAPAATEAAPAATEAAPAKPYEGVKLTLGYIPIPDIDGATAYLEEVVAAFEEETGATVEYAINDSAELVTKYLTNFMGETQYDVFYIPPGNLVDFIDEGFIEPMDNWYSAEEIASEKMWNTALYSDNKVYGVPFEGGIAYRTYAYNMDILNECGVTELPTTWEELEAVCAKIQEKRPDVYPFLVPMADIHCIFNCIYPFLIQAGGSIFNADKTAIQVNSPEMKRAFEFISGMVDKGYLSTDALGLGLANVRDLFTQGQAAIIVTNNPHMYVGEFEAAASTNMKDVTYGSYNAVAVLSMNAACENKEAAAALIKFMNGPEGTEIFTKYRERAKMRDTDPDFPVEPILEDVFAHPERAFVDPMYHYPGSFFDSWLSTTQQIVAGTIEIDEALVQFQAQMDAEQAS